MEYDWKKQVWEQTHLVSGELVPWLVGEDMPGEVRCSHWSRVFWGLRSSHDVWWREWRALLNPASLVSGGQLKELQDQWQKSREGERAVESRPRANPLGQFNLLSIYRNCQAPW